MKKLLLIFCLLFCGQRIFAQQFSQYNTGTLFDSFENPSQKSFTPDTSRQFASNFLFPNFDGNISLTGNGQQTLRDRLFSNTYNNKALQIGNGSHLNNVNANANAYLVMLKMFASLDGDEELGFFIQTKGVARGVFTDETIALLNGSNSFPGNSYNNIFNSNYHYQSYYQFGVTYREQVTKQFALGFKLASVTGMNDENVNITQSSINFDRAADTAALALKGTNEKAGFSTLPFSNPGVSVSIGGTYKTRDAFIIQGNIKDLGFIHWNKNAETYYFHGAIGLYDLSTGNRESNVYSAFKQQIDKSKTYTGSYNTPLDGRAELSVNKSFWIDDDDMLKYSPTLIASKELFYNGFTAAMVNPVQYKNYVVSLVTSYDNNSLFDLGAQFMVKSANAEFFIASDRIAQSASLVTGAIKSSSNAGAPGSFTGGDIMIGFSLKFGNVIEHPMNASTIPMGEKGFLGKLWDKIFKPSDQKALQK